jgi:hypothetical protein
VLSSWDKASLSMSGADDGFMELVGKLIANGVGSSVAEQLAREKPDDCQQCLEYLPFVRVKSSKGAHFANAIRGGYGPPPEFDEARKRTNAGRTANHRPSTTEANQRGNWMKKERGLKESLEKLKALHPEKAVLFRLTLNPNGRRQRELPDIFLRNESKKSFRAGKAKKKHRYFSTDGWRRPEVHGATVGLSLLRSDTPRSMGPRRFGL